MKMKEFTMNHITLLAFILFAFVLHGQQDILGSRTIHGDLTVNGAVTLPVSRGTTLPATCTVGQLFFRTQTQIGIHECRVTNTWTYLGSGGGGGVSSLNSLTGVLSIARTNDTNIQMTITPSGSTVSLDLSWAGALAKVRQHAATSYTDQSNTFGAFRQSLTSSASEPALRLIPYAGDPTTPLDGDIWYNSSTNKFRCRVNGTTTDCDTGGGSAVTRTAVSFSATPTFTRSSALQQWTMTLTGDVTSSTLSGASAGDLLSFEFTQDSTPRTVVMPTGFPALALCATSGSVTVAQYFWTGSAAIERSVNSPGCTERVIRWQDGTATTFPAGSDTVATLGGTQTFSGAKTFTGRLNLPNSTTRPATCIVGDVYIDTDATSGQRVYICESTDTWVVQGGGGGGGGASILYLQSYCSATLGSGTTGWCGPNASWAALENGAQYVAQKAGTLKNLRVITQSFTNPNMSCVVRKNAASTSIVASWSAGASAGTIINDTTNTASIAVADLITLQCTATGATGPALTWHVEVE